MTDSIFGTKKETPVSESGNVADPAAPEMSDANKQLLAGIVDENGRQKYATIADAMQGLDHANQYIGQLHQKVDGLEGEKVALSADLASRKTVTELMDTLAPNGVPEQAPQGYASSHCNRSCRRRTI